MKKLFQSSKYKKYNKKHAYRLNRRRIRSKEKKRQKRRLEQLQNRAANLSNIHSYAYRNKRTNEAVIQLPENFSIADNTEEVLDVFKLLKNYVAKRDNIYFEMSKIKKLTGDVIIYMLSMFDWNRKKYGRLNIRGNIPEDKACRDLLRSSGFFKYIEMPAFNIEHHEHIFEIEKDSVVRPLLAQKIVHFAKKHLGNIDREKATSTYNTLIECMANTKNHAFEEKSIHPLWYLMAIYDPEQQCVTVTFLDAGLGIPRTIRLREAQTFKERVALFAKKIHKNIKILSDTELIASVLEGAPRTRTELVYRGKGLPTIYKYYVNKQLEDLTVISRKGYLDLNGGKKVLSGTFSGTMISWKIKRNPNGG